MKTLGKSIVIALIFFVGTVSLIHVDRQNAWVNRKTPEIATQITESVENIIEKYASLL